jgi:hypothetical protein
MGYLLRSYSARAHRTRRRGSQVSGQAREVDGTSTDHRGAHQRALEQTREFVYQHRVGHFHVECRISDGDRVIGVGVVELEVLFKGRFSEVGLPASPPV